MFSANIYVSQYVCVYVYYIKVSLHLKSVLKPTRTNKVSCMRNQLERSSEMCVVVVPY